MRIWLINHYAVPPKYYPLARQACFAKYLIKKGHDVVIISASTVHNSELNLIDDNVLWKEDISDGIKYVYIKCHGYKDNGIPRIFNMYEFAYKLWFVYKKLKKPDAIVATSMPPMSCLQGLKIAKKLHVKAIAEIADLWPESLIAYGITGENSLPTRYLRKMEKKIYQTADRIIFTMEGAYDYILDKKMDDVVPRNKVVCINNGVDLDLFNANKEKYQLYDEDLLNKEYFSVVYTGSIRRVNNVGMILEVAKLIRNPKIKFLIYGDGNELESLKEKSRLENVDNVIFKGKVDKKYIPCIVSNASVNYMHGEKNYLFKYGISPNKLFDYFAAGKPIICDLCSNYNPITKYEAGIDIQNNSPECIAEEIEKMANLSNQEYDYYCKNSLKAAKNYDFKNLTDVLLGVLGE